MGEITTHYKGRYLDMLERDGWEYASRCNATGVVVLIAVTDADEILLVEQYRKPVMASVIELPAGLVGDAADPDESMLDAAGHRVVSGGDEIRLGPTEYRLLRFLMAHPDRVYSRTQLLDRVWGANVYVEERTVDVHVRRLRKALAEKGADAYIQTVRGAGYRFSVREA